jgi:hypothetical protein
LEGNFVRSELEAVVDNRPISYLADAVIVHHQNVFPDEIHT